MPNYFEGKICVFLGRLETMSKKEAGSRLFGAGGVAQNTIPAFTSHVIVGTGAENTLAFQKAKSLENEGCLTILTERQFLNALDGKFIPPENPNIGNNNVIVIPGKYPPDAEKELYDRVVQNKKAAYLATKGVLIPDGNVKADIQPYVVLKKLIDKNNEG